MAYVRTHGNQVAIVHGERDPQTKKVQQRILFSLYSKPEALAALGRGEERSWDLEHMLRNRHQGVRFNWPKIQAGIEERVDELPDGYPYRTAQLQGRFREDLVALIRQLELADPQSMHSAARLLSEQRGELEHLRDLIDWRLKLSEQKENQWNGDNEFFWRHRLQPHDITPEAMERLSEAWNRRELDRVETLARLYLEVFDGYADGHHFLGLVALERDDLETALEQFDRTMTVGQTLFPKRLAKKHYWTDHATRPYMRGLRSFTVTLTRCAAYKKALAFCDRLERECGDDLAAMDFRAAVYLNMGRWEEARDQANKLIQVWPVFSLYAAFASFELGDWGAALASFLHGVLNRPRTARMLLDRPSPAPEGYDEARDHNGGIEECADLAGFLGRQTDASKGFFRGLLAAPEIAALVAEKRETIAQRNKQRATADREAFDRMQQMSSIEFAREQAQRLRHLAG